MQHKSPQPGQWLTLASLAALTVGLWAEPATAAPFWFVDPITRYGELVNDTYQVMSWICLAILIIVEVALVAALVKFRRRPGDTRLPETWSHNTKLELIWTAIPFALLIVMMVPTFRALAYFADVPKNPELTLEVVGHQFYWEYRYPELKAAFNSTPRTEKGDVGQPLLIPVGRKIKVVLTAADVIHSWWIPAFGFQQMTTPGNLVMAPLEIRPEYAGKEYFGACSFLCGPQHGEMITYVRPVTNTDFLAWAAQHPAPGTQQTMGDVGNVGKLAPPPESNEKPEGEEEGAAPVAAAGPTAEEAKALAAKGAPIFASKCAGCHMAGGEGGYGPTLQAAEPVNGSDKDFVSIILKGKSGPLTVKGKSYNGMMPPQGAGMSDEEVAAVATFVRTSWGNNGKAIGPAQVKALR